MGSLMIRLASLADRVGLVARAASMRRSGWGPPGLLVVLYHRVATRSQIGALDPDLIDATPDEFDEQMAYLRRHYRPVGLEEVLEAHRAGRDLPSGSVLVTFDDGYLDNFENAFPVLRRHDMRAVFFVSTGHLTERRLFWWERLALLVRRSTVRSPRIEYPVCESFDGSSEGAKLGMIRRLNRIVKDHYGLDLERFYAGVERALGVSWSAAEDHALADAALMRWDQVRALRQAGMGIGSHTRWHRVLQTLPPPTLGEELRASRAALETELGEPITTIAYPVGKAISRIGPVRRAVVEAGYELGFTTRPGLNRFSARPDPFDLRRLPIDRGAPLALKRTWMALPFLAP
jgi:peptidoglycan/xylan/chitin deacetylase (PgdA/CDA1 family)